MCVPRNADYDMVTSIGMKELALLPAESDGEENIHPTLFHGDRTIIPNLSRGQVDNWSISHQSKAITCKAQIWSSIP